MKKVFALILVTFVTIAYYTNAQPQWKFHIAFEDGTGAKDTMWFIWDTSATLLGIDTTLGEGNVNFNYESFNVFSLIGFYPELDSTKVYAITYDEYFELQIKAFNYILPLKLSWDTSLFHADYLPPEPVGWINYARLYNTYFSIVHNNPDFQEFDMTLIDTVTCPDPSLTDPWFWQPWIHFPMDFFMHQEELTSVKPYFCEKFSRITCYPNPFDNFTTIEFELKKPLMDVSLIIIDSKGNKVKTLINSQDFTNGVHKINWYGDNDSGHKVPEGIYFYKLVTDGQMLVKKAIVVK